MQPQIKVDYEISVLDKGKSYYITKRCIDIIGALIGLILFSPLYLFLIIAIKLDSPGPAIFAHKRYGKGGKFINVYKFRSMYKNAEEMLKKLTPEQKKEWEENFKLKDDPRITKVGKFLRKTSLDELPQFLNVLKGDMSLVGPRPIVEKELEKYGKYADKFLSVKPGLTGLWQVSGRSDVTYEERVRLDMEYIDNRSIIYDFKIILKTFIIIFTKKSGAY